MGNLLSFDDILWNFNCLNSFHFDWNLSYVLHRFYVGLINCSFNNFFNDFFNLYNFLNNSGNGNYFLHNLLNFNNFRNFHNLLNNFLNNIRSRHKLLPDSFDRNNFLFDKISRIFFFNNMNNRSINLNNNFFFHDNWNLNMHRFSDNFFFSLNNWLFSVLSFDSNSIMYERNLNYSIDWFGDFNNTILSRNFNNSLNYFYFCFVNGNLFYHLDCFYHLLFLD